MSGKGSIRIGTSGWNYPHWKGRFYPDELSPDEWFEHYAGVFDTVEVNNTFYQLPDEGTFRSWQRQAPRGFLYALKASRYLTHMKKLKDPGEPLGQFFKLARLLGDRLGPVLFQLPPHWKCNVERLEAFCSALPKQAHAVMEFRERDWLNDDVYSILEKHSVGLCVHDLLKRHPRRVTSEIVYVRFHGSGEKYGGSYPRRRLESWAEWLRECEGKGCRVFAFFNNDAKAHAVRNARTLRELI